MIDLYNYLLQTNPEQLIVDGKDIYRLKDHHSLVISNGKWYWFSHDFGGYTAYQYLRKVENLSVKEAKKALANIDLNKVDPIKKRKKNQLFFLPKASTDLNELYDYLINDRKLDKRIVDQCINDRLIYLDEKKENIVFVGYDALKIPRFACTRNIHSNQKKDMMNSNKEYSFHLEGSTSTLHLFEAPIDLLSYLSLLVQLDLRQDDHYLSLGGLSDKALERYLKEHLIDQLIFHLDHDEAGINAYQRMYKQYQDRYKIYDKSVTNYKDINELLVEHIKQIEEII